MTNLSLNNEEIENLLYSLDITSERLEESGGSEELLEDLDRLGNKLLKSKN